jgi:peroxin-11B
MWSTLDSNKDLSGRFKGLFSNPKLFFLIPLDGMKNARKLFRLFKSLNEYHKIRQMLKKPDEDDATFYLNLLSRIGFLAYWVFDNLNVLADIKFLNIDAKKNGKNAATCWFIALVFGLILYVRDLIKVSHSQVSAEKSAASGREEEQERTRNLLKSLKQKKFEAVLNILKTLGDMITASQGSEFAPKVLKINFNDGWVGFGGFLSAVITSYQLY